MPLELGFDPDKINWVDTGADEELLKSLQSQESGEQLSKSVDKSKLVQKEVVVQGKNGPYKRMQWVRVKDDGDDSKSSKDSGTKDDKPAKDDTPSSDNGGNAALNQTIGAYISGGKGATTQARKAGLANILGDGNSRADIMAAAEANGVTWRKSDHPGINWMRAAMALTGATTRGAAKDAERDAARASSNSK